MLELRFRTRGPEYQFGVMCQRDEADQRQSCCFQLLGCHGLGAVRGNRGVEHRHQAKSIGVTARSTESAQFGRCHSRCKRPHPRLGHDTLDGDFGDTLRSVPSPIAVW
jgi:hypothetical protein